MLITFKIVDQIVLSNYLLITLIFCTVHGKSLDEVIVKANNSLDSLSKWFAANKLSLSVDKTSYNVFLGNQMTKKHNFILQLCNNDIKQVSCCKYLGVELEQKGWLSPTERASAG